MLSATLISDYSFNYQTGSKSPLHLRAGTEINFNRNRYTTGFSVDAVIAQDIITKSAFDDLGILAILLNGDGNAVYNTDACEIHLLLDSKRIILSVLGDNVIYSDPSDNFEQTIYSKLEAITT